MRERQEISVSQYSLQTSCEDLVFVTKKTKQKNTTWILF